MSVHADITPLIERARQAVIASFTRTYTSPSNGAVYVVSSDAARHNEDIAYMLCDILADLGWVGTAREVFDRFLTDALDDGTLVRLPERSSPVHRDDIETLRKWET